jgi:Rab-GTPase-TBC domain
MKEPLRFIDITLPEVAEKLLKSSMDPSIFASQWFITLFAYSMPFQFVARVWDLFFLRKWSVIFRISITLLEMVQAEFLQAKDMEAMLHVLKSIPERINKLEDVGVLIERAMRLNLDEEDVRVLGNVGNAETDGSFIED